MRRFLQRFAALDAQQWGAATDAFAALERTSRYRAADQALARSIERTGRAAERDAVLGPLLQIVRTPDASDEQPVAAAALAATLAVMMRDVLDETTFATLYAPFAALIWADAL